VTIQGKLFTLSFETPIPRKEVERKRKNIKTFSDGARLRLLKFIATIDWGKLPMNLFITLTYPDSVALRSKAQRNRDRYLFQRYMEKHLSQKVSILWRVEWKNRKTGEHVGRPVPHMHMIVFGVRPIHHLLIRKWWRSILHVSGPLCTDVRGFKDGEKESIYIAKYIGKEVCAPSLDYVTYVNSSGRHYGITRKHLLPQHAIKIYKVTDMEELMGLTSTAACVLPWMDPEGIEGFSLLGDKAVEVGKDFVKRDLAKRRRKG